MYTSNSVVGCCDQFIVLRSISCDLLFLPNITDTNMITSITNLTNTYPSSTHILHRYALFSQSRTLHHMLDWTSS
uniref:Uncharacterized protein n=1 Tax=viral metagenome TaxID=1070528 RepID=A0A6C0BKJ7_9ZZZZ